MNGYPIVNNNGATAASLVEYRSVAFIAIREAMRAL